MLLEHTQEALRELASNSQFGMGVHIDQAIRTGVPGTPVGEVPFDPSRHSLLDANPLSAMEHMTGQPYVTQVLPHRPAEFSVVLDNTAGEEHPKIAAMKGRLAAKIMGGLERVIPSVTDRANIYFTSKYPDLDTGYAEPIDGGNDYETAVRVAQVCTQGLSFIISDFNHLPLGETGYTLDHAIGIKVTHPAELWVPRGVGTIALGKGVEVDTTNPRQVNEVNDLLAQRHNDLICRLTQAGMIVVCAMFSPKSKSGLTYDDTLDLDMGLADSVKTYAKSKH